MQRLQLVASLTLRARVALPTVTAPALPVPIERRVLLLSLRQEFVWHPFLYQAYVVSLDLSVKKTAVGVSPFYCCGVCDVSNSSSLGDHCRVRGCVNESERAMEWLMVSDGGAFGDVAVGRLRRC